MSHSQSSRAIYVPLISVCSETTSGVICGITPRDERAKKFGVSTSFRLGRARRPTLSTPSSVAIVFSTLNMPCSGDDSVISGGCCVSYSNSNSRDIDISMYEADRCLPFLLPSIGTSRYNFLTFWNLVISFVFLLIA